MNKKKVMKKAQRLFCGLGRKEVSEGGAATSLRRLFTFTNDLGQTFLSVLSSVKGQIKS